MDLYGKNVTMAKIWGFAPYSGAKNAKKWRISAGLRVKIDRWGVKNALLGVGNTKKTPVWAFFLVSGLFFSDVCRTVRIL